MKADSWGGSRMGSGRQENQDAWGTDPARGLYVLCDGMGGHTAGQVASQLAAESALRAMTVHYPYDAHKEGEIALSTHAPEISEKLKVELQERLANAGVRVLEARISHLAYAPEIASAMLQRQQASAIIAARQKIVEGAVGMVETALDLLATRRVVDLDTERRAAMVSNLLVVLCAERGTQPVVNAGSLYQ